MKTISILFIYLLTSFCFAGITIPKGVYNPDQIEAAKAEAVEQKKVLAFVYTDSKTNCGICINHTQEAFKKFKPYSVIVLIDSITKNKWLQISPVAVTALHSNQMGNVIPRAAITSADALHLIASLNSKDLGKQSAYSDAKQAATAFKKSQNPPSFNKTCCYSWPSISGGFFTGTFKGLKDNKNIILLIKSDNKIYNISCSHLSPSSIEFIKQFSGEDDTSTPEKTAKEFPLEKWTATNGKNLQAKFIVVEDQTITLEMEDGKKHSIPLERLDVASQEKAKKYSANP